jgi:hypothetical protein
MDYEHCYHIAYNNHDCTKTQISPSCLCSGCEPPCAVDLQLNSRTYNIALETSGGTCSQHRYLRTLERQHIQTVRKTLHRATQTPRAQHLRRLLNHAPSTGGRGTAPSKRTASVYDFPSDSEIEQGNVCILF